MSPLTGASIGVFRFVSKSLTTNLTIRHELEFLLISWMQKWGDTCLGGDMHESNAIFKSPILIAVLPLFSYDRKGR